MALAVDPSPKRAGLVATVSLGALIFLTACTPPGDGSVGSLDVGSLPDNGLEGLDTYFSKYISVFGVHIAATAGVPDAKIEHAAHVMAQYLDNDEDGTVDDPPVLESMLDNNALLVMFQNSDALESSGIFEDEALHNFAGQDLQGDETHPEGSSQEGFDAALEEVWHLINTSGHAGAYPTIFGFEESSELTAATDAARGGYFEGVPNEYPEEAWYHYDDTTCDHACQVVEYFYWAMTSILGAQDYPGRCEEIAVEWEPCTPALMEQTDPTIHQLLTGAGHALPTRLPDGNYNGN